jgi:hypothetical protein
MGQKRKYRKKSDSFVTAVQIDLDTPGLKYNKWGGEQVAKRGDWLVDNNGDKYTVAEDSFATTYEFVSPGVYVKSAPVWAEIADRAGTVKTQEGETAYKAGDYLLSNKEDGTDAYAMTEEKFKSMYELADD